jgi:hypothetical protein
MRYLFLAPLAILSLARAYVACADDVPGQGNVELTVAVDHDQPAGWPVVVEVTLKNTGAAPIKWWCGGPGLYPGAEHFIVKVRYGPDRDWLDARATNGQYFEGSGSFRELKPGEIIVVPLAIPTKRTGGLSFTIRPAEWRTAKPVEGFVMTSDVRAHADNRQARVIAAAIAQSPPFWRHLAEDYPDAVVMDAMLKLVTVDNASIAGGAARVLAFQLTLPESAGDSLAPLVDRWLPRSPRPEWGGLREYIVRAALRTQSEAARATVLKAMTEAHDANSRRIAIDELRLSPGDIPWLRRARDAIAAFEQAGGGDPGQTKRAVEWLDARIKYPQP